MYKQTARKAGKRPGAPGYGRTQVLKVSDEELHRAPVCAACGQALGEQSAIVARTGHYVVDLQWGDEQCPGLRGTNTKHL